MYACMHVHVHMCMHVHARAYVQGEVKRVEVMGKCIRKLFMLVWHMCMCACVCVYGRMHDMHVRARAHMRACMHVHACAHVHMCKHVEVKGWGE